MNNHDTHALSVQVNHPWGMYLKYGLLFTLVWVLLTQGDMRSWIIGILVVPLSTWCALHLFQPTAEHAVQKHRAKIHLGAALQFIPYFLQQSFKGGWESALFAIIPSRRVRPAFVRYTTGLPDGSARLVFINVVSLLPGTVSAGIQGEQLHIHVLDAQADNLKALHECENQIAKLFGLNLKQAPLTSINEEEHTR